MTATLKAQEEVGCHVFFCDIASLCRVVWGDADKRAVLEAVVAGPL